MLNIKNLTSSFFTKLSYTSGYTELFVRVYDCLESSSIASVAVTIKIDENFDPYDDILQELMDDAGSFFYDIQTSVRTISLLSMAILNRDYIVYGEYKQRSGDQLDLLQKTFDFCLYGAYLLMDNIRFYDAQGLTAISSALELTVYNPNLETSENMVSMINTLLTLISNSNSVYGINDLNTENFLTSAYTLAPINNTMVIEDAYSLYSLSNFTNTVLIGYSKAMGLGENNTLEIGNVTVDTQIVTNSSLNNYKLSSSKYPNSYVELPGDLINYLDPSISEFSVNLVAIPQKDISNFQVNLNETQPMLLEFTLINKQGQSIIKPDLKNSYINISIPIEGKPENYTPGCYFIDEKTGEWSNKGCYLFAVYEDSVICQCNHFTLFSATDMSRSALSTLESSNIASIYDFDLLYQLDYTNAAGLYIFLTMLVLYIAIGIVVRHLDVKFLKSAAENHKNLPQEPNANYEESKTQFKVKKFNSSNPAPKVKKHSVEEKKSENEEKIIISDSSSQDSDSPDEFDEENLSFQGIPIEKVNKSQEFIVINSFDEDINHSTEKDEGSNKKETVTDKEKNNGTKTTESATIRQEIIKSHEFFRVIYRPNKLETRFAILTIIFVKIMVELFINGLFFQNDFSDNGEPDFGSFVESIKEYSWPTFWYAVWSAIIGFVVGTTMGLLLIHSKSLEPDFINDYSNIKRSHKIKKIAGYCVAWSIFLFTGWSVIMFSIKFNDSSKGLWLFGSFLAILFDFFVSSIISGIVKIYAKRLVIIFVKTVKR